MRLGERPSSPVVGLKARAPLYIAVVVAAALWRLHSAAVAYLVRSAGWHSDYSELAFRPRFLAVLLVASLGGAAIAVTLAPLLRLARKSVTWGCVAGSVPEATLPLLAVAGLFRQPWGAIAVVTSIVNVLSWPGRLLASVLGCYSMTWRWATGISIPLTVDEARCWSIVMAGNVLFYGLAWAASVSWVARRRNDKPA
jgi:hypothetical protein